jgi:arginase
VCLVGPRSFEPEEHDLLTRMGVRIIDADDVRSLGLNEAMREAVSIAAAAPGGFGVTVDLDAIDPEQAPGVGSPVPGGLHAAELIDALNCWCAVHAPMGVEVVEYNPARDRDGATAGIARALIGAALNLPA